MDSSRAKFQRAAGDLRRDIERGIYVVDAKLPTLAKLAETYDVSRVTMQRAVAILQDEGIIESWPGDGSYVRSTGLRPIVEGMSTEHLAAELTAMRQAVEVISRKIVDLEGILYERTAQDDQGVSSTPQAPDEDA